MTKSLFEIENFSLFPYERTLDKGDNIPEKKGIYAWYLDYSKFKKFKTKEEFALKLKLLDSLIATDELNGSVKSFFRNYNVKLEENRLFVEKYVSDITEEEIVFGERLKKMSLEDCKKVMDLMANFSVLVNPLYVGISISLKNRWYQHRKSFNKVREMQDMKEDENLILQEGLKSFGGRVALKGFNWEYLIFACVEKEIDRNLIAESEFLINRFYSPLFGRK
ncbi:hypothetical protein [Cellulophaga lytica]|uniref:hypothetical protein n=1 Tax=Cellulophaga lytica TaxID=979 RepID=UPI000B5C6420|nr:hypothetical protein [Cellulophaga lytica]SNQ43841.1 hypothetical protein CL8139_390054 [Cellulophaga lytica]